VATWDDIVKDAPEFAAKVRRRFEMGTNKTIATLRRDGSPRITAIEAQFTGGEVTMGMMAESLKMRDVRRDPRMALHSPTNEFEADDPDWPGDAKLAGRAIEMPAPPDSEPGDRVLAPRSGLAPPDPRLDQGLLALLRRCSSLSLFRLVW
jgi:hypothetical protein